MGILFGTPLGLLPVPLIDPRLTVSCVLVLSNASVLPVNVRLTSTQAPPRLIEPKLNEQPLDAVTTKRSWPAAAPSLVTVMVHPEVDGPVPDQVEQTVFTAIALENVMTTLSPPV